MSIEDDGWRVVAQSYLWRWFLLVVALLFTPGCQPAHIQEPLLAGWADNDSHARTEFWYSLPNRAVVGNDEVFHGLLLYVDDADPCVDYAARVNALKALKILPSNFNGKANDIADRGTLAVALVHALKIDGGVNMHLFGDVPRYAVRALEYRGVYPPSSPNQGISGGQFVGIMEKAEEYERGNPADAPAAKLPGEIQHPGGPLAAANAKRVPPAATNPGEIETIPRNFSLIQPVSLALDPEPMSTVAIAQSSVFQSGHSVLLSYSDGSGRYGESARSFRVPQDGAQRIIAQECRAFEAPANDAVMQPFYLADAAPTTAPAASGPKKLNVIITGVEGDSAEVRKSENDPWARARVGMVVHDSAEFRTGPKSAIRFIIPPDQTFCLDSQGTTKVLDAVATGNKVKTDIGLVRGRMRYDVDKGTTNVGEPVRIEQAGIEHDATIRSPNSALALRGTKVSLFDQPGFEPEAISLSGAAIYVNTVGQRIPFGGVQRAAIRGAQTSAPQQAADRAESLQSPQLALLDFENRETEIVIQRGGFVSGDVVVGDLHLSDFHNKLPGVLDFVLQWGPTPQSHLNDLNLAVASPLYSSSNRDFVANPPFVVSLDPSNPVNEQLRATKYPQTSASGGSISKNSDGPHGLEIASWPATYPVGTYDVTVFNYINAATPSTKVINPVTYTIDVFLNGKDIIHTYTGTVGFLQTSKVLLVPVTATPVVSPIVTKPASPGVPQSAAESPKVVDSHNKTSSQRGR